MHINFQLKTGKQMNIHPGLQDAWQEIVNIYPELDEVAEWDCLQAKLLKVIPQRKAELEHMEKLDRIDVKYSYRKKDMLPTISVMHPKSLAYTVGWYLDFAYGSTCAHLGEKDPVPFSRTPLSCSDNLALLDPNNPLHNREEMMVPMNPHYAFVLSWRRFENWHTVVEALIHDLHLSSRNYIKVPESMMPGAIR